MVFVASKEPATLVQGSPPGRFRLRVVGSERDGQIVELGAAKCSIGSAAGCTLRLRARGVRNVHCLVLRGATGTLARAWAPNTRLNGQPFRDALLAAGDRLSIGPVEFEVLDMEGPPTDPTDAGRTVVLDRRPAPIAFPSPSAANTPRRQRRRQQIHNLVREVRRLRDQLEQARQTTAESPPDNTAHQLHERLEHYRQESQRWEATLETLQAELDGRQQQLDEQQSEWDSHRAELERQREQWQVELTELREQRDQHRRQASETESELRVIRQQHALDQQELQAQLAALQQDLAGLEAELITAREHHQAAAASLAQLDERSTELDQRSQQLDERTARLDNLQQQLAERTCDLDDRERACREAHTANEQRAAELAQAAEEFSSQQAEAWRLLEEQRTSAAELEQAHRDTLAGTEQLREQVSAREQQLATREQVVAEQQASLRAEQERLAEERAARELQWQQREQALEQRAAELAAAEREVAERQPVTAEPQPLVGEPNTQQLETLAARASELEQQFQAFARQRQEWDAEQSRRNQQLEQAAQRLEDERHQFDQQRDHLHQQLSEQTGELESLRQQLDEARQALAQQDHTTQHDADESQQRLEEQQADLLRQQAALAEAQAILAAERQALEDERRRLSDRAAADAEQLERERAELQQQREAWQAAREQFDSEHGPASYASGREQHTTPDPADEPARIDESPIYERRVQAADTERAEASAADTHRQFSPNSDDEDSVEAYMAALLNRMRSGNAHQPPPRLEELPKRNRRRSDSAQEPAAEPVAPPIAEPPVPAAPVLDLPTAPQQLERRVSKELPANLNVLREIGITHARSAIETHGQQRSLRQAYGTLATSLFCFLAAFLVFHFSHSGASRLTAAAILIIGIFWLGSSIWAVKKVFASMHKKRSGLRAMMEEIEAEIALLEKERAEAEANVTPSDA